MERNSYVLQAASKLGKTASGAAAPGVLRLGGGFHPLVGSISLACYAFAAHALSNAFTGCFCLNKELLEQ